MHFTSASILTVALTLGVNTTFGQAEIQDTKNTVAEWVKTRHLISEERADWLVEQESLEMSLALLSQELENLDNSIQDVAATTTKSDQQKRELELERLAIEEADAAIAQSITEMEAQIRRLVKTFPAPLLQRVEAALSRIPSDPEVTTATSGARLSNILVILQQAEKFNNTLTLATDTRKEGERKIQVSVLYWGLAQAYYVDMDRTVAGIGKPSAEGWTWTPAPEHAKSIGEMVSIYEGTGDVKFVTLPVKAQ
jgi:hypothetical protein